MEEQEIKDCEIKNCEMKRGKNPFIVDGSLGRIGFLKTFAVIILIYVIFMIAIIPLHDIIPLTKRDTVINIMALVLGLSFLYTILISYMKRLYDITYNKGKSIFYVIAFAICCFLVSNFIPKLGFLRPWLHIIMLAMCLFLPKGFLQKYFK